MRRDGRAINTYATGTAPALIDQAVTERVNRALQDFLDAQIAADTTGNWQAVLAVIAGFVNGKGKRLRPQFCYWGWRGAGGDDGQAVIGAAASLELLHAFALIHDDIMDASDTRRGRPTVHRSLAGLHERQGWAGVAERFGINAAILCGDLLAFWSDEMLHGCGLSVVQLAAARPLLDRMRTELCAGQYFDLHEQAAGGTLEGALRVIRYKAARYTVERPLQIGGMLAGADADLLRFYSDYGIRVGEAFQLRDDLLGVFGDSAVTGKSVLDDLRDGKATVLMALARRHATAAQRTLIDSLHGNPDLDAAGAAALSHTITRTGALDRVEDMIAERTLAALNAVDQAPVAEDVRIALRDLAVHAARRQT